MSITVFETPGCVQCNATKKQLSLRNIEYDNYDYRESPQAQQIAAEAGYMTAPVVMVEHEGQVLAHWSGFRPDKIKEYAKAQAKVA